MKQTRAMSLVESIANVFVGYGIAVATQILIFPVFGLHTTLAQNLQMGAAFTGISIVRSFALRRLFEAIRVRKTGSDVERPSCGVKSCIAASSKTTATYAKPPVESS